MKSCWTPTFSWPFRSKRGASHELVRGLGQVGLRLNISVALALEYEDVLKRTDMLHDISETAIDDFLDYLFSIANLVPIVRRQRPRLRDPDDERILEVAVQCNAMIVTYNKKDFVGAEELGVIVRAPAEVLRMLRESQ